MNHPPSTALAASARKDLTQTLRVLSAQDGESLAPYALALSNDTDLQRPRPETIQDIATAMNSSQAIALHFPKFTDGRAFSQAVLLRRRFGFRGNIIATGDVLIDLLAQMARCGFNVAILRSDQVIEHASQRLTHYPAYYQYDDAA